jgi:uracil-DNA glycosylase
LPSASFSLSNSPGATQSPTIALPKATTREELRKSLEAHPDALALLELELETLGEDWLIALQDELTKPYFLKVGGNLGVCS